MDFHWEKYENHVRDAYTRIVYSDDDEFYDYDDNIRYIFIKKENGISFVLKYDSVLKTFTRYKVPNYNRKCAHMILKEEGEPYSVLDIKTNADLCDYKCKA
jgi:hypothetical protein